MHNIVFALYLHDYRKMYKILYNIC